MGNNQRRVLTDGKHEEEPDSKTDLAEMSGFGSVLSMQRAFRAVENG